jgi:hypothetical protein
MSMTLKEYLSTSGKKLEDIAADLAKVLADPPDLSTISRHANRRRAPDWEAMDAYKKVSGGLVDFEDWRPAQASGIGGGSANAHSG